MMAGGIIVGLLTVTMVDREKQEMRRRPRSDCSNYHSRDEDGWCCDDRKDASSRRNKQEREVDEEGFETVFTRLMLITVSIITS